MEDVVELLKEISVSSFEQNSEHWVDITYIHDPHHFYTRLTKYRILIQKIESTKPVLKPSSVNVHDIILFNFDCNPKYARGQVCYVENNEGNLICDIFALDYGYFKKGVPFEYIWECNQLLLNMPPLAVNCQLANCAPRGTNWSNETIEVFKFFVKNERAKMIVLNQTVNKLTVMLYNTNPDDIATLLVLTDYSYLQYTHNAINKLQCTSLSRCVYYYNFHELKTNDVLQVRVLSGMTLKGFYVADICNYKKYLEECDNITYYSQKESEVNVDCVKSGDLICVKDCLNKYKRGIIKEILTNTKALVHLVDLGKYEEVNFMNMKKLPKQCLTMPVVAIFCCAEDDQAWDNGLHRFLYPGFEFLITIKNPGHQFESPNVVKITPLHMFKGKQREKRF